MDGDNSDATTTYYIGKCACISLSATADKIVEQTVVATLLTVRIAPLQFFYLQTLPHALARTRQKYAIKPFALYFCTCVFFSYRKPSIAIQHRNPHAPGLVRPRRCFGKFCRVRRTIYRPMHRNIRRGRNALLGLRESTP